MPYKNKEKRNEYMRLKMQRRRSADKVLSDWKSKIKIINDEFNKRAILPRHIYYFRVVLEDMLESYFEETISRNPKTELITKSYKILEDWIKRYG